MSQASRAQERRWRRKGCGDEEPHPEPEPHRCSRCVSAQCRDAMTEVPEPSRAASLEAQTFSFCVGAEAPWPLGPDHHREALRPPLDRLHGRRGEQAAVRPRCARDGFRSQEFARTCSGCPACGYTWVTDKGRGRNPSKTWSESGPFCGARYRIRTCGLRSNPAYLPCFGVFFIDDATWPPIGATLSPEAFNPARTSPSPSPRIQHWFPGSCVRGALRPQAAHAEYDPPPPPAAWDPGRGVVGLLTGWRVGQGRDMRSGSGACLHAASMEFGDG